MASYASPRPSLLMLAGFVGFHIGISLILNSPYSGSLPNQGLLKDNPSYLILVVVLGVQVGVWAIIALAVWTALYALRQYARQDRLEHLFSSVVFVALFSAPGLVFGPYDAVKLPQQFFGELAGRFENMVTLGVALVALPSAAGIWFVRSGLRRLAAKTSFGDAELETFVELRSHLQRFLTGLGIVVGAATLTIGAIRNAALSEVVFPRAEDGSLAVPVPALSENAFPATYVWLAGLYFTAILALTYLPAHLTMAAAGARIVNALFRLEVPTESRVTAPSALAWDKRLGNRKLLEETLQHRAGFVPTLQASVAILTPIIGSVVGLLLGTSMK